MSELVYERRGSGRPLVLIHGLGSRKEVWNPIVDLLVADRDVIALDLPGFGHSPADGPLGVYPFVDRVTRFIADLGLDRPDVAGSSMGGGVALELARRGVAGRVVTYSPIGFWSTAERLWTQAFLNTLVGAVRVVGNPLQRHIDAPAVRALFAGLYGDPGRVPSEQARTDLEGARITTGFRASSRSFAGYRFGNGAELDGVPVTIAWGTRDILLPYRTQPARARRELPRARHVSLPGAGHIPFSDDPRLCAELLLRD